MTDRTENIRRSARIQTKQPEHRDAFLGLVEDMKEEIQEIEEPSVKQTELFSQGDVGGKGLYSFKRSRKGNMMKKAEDAKNHLQVKASNSNDDKKPLTLKLVIDKLNLTGQQSYRIKEKDLSGSASQSSESESVSEDEYKPNESESEDEEDDNEEEDNNESNESDSEGKETASEEEFFDATEPEVSKSPVKKREIKRNQTVTPHVYSEYRARSTQFFESQGEKIKTSNKTLSRLKNSTLKPEQMKKFLAMQSHISKEHLDALNRLREKCYDAFPMWEFILDEGFNILLYGLGSKRNIILDFQKEMVPDHPSVIVNGYFPSLTLREIMDAIIVDLLEMNPVTDPNECVDIVNKIMRDNPHDRLYLFVHNIDGFTLISDKAQDFLSRLADIPNVCMIASIDHTNAPILWDNVKRSRFNFFCWDATTFLPYQEETSYESSLLVQHSGILALSSLQNVFQSLTPNAKQIYIMLVKYQLENGNSAQYQGMPFKQLYEDAREKFLVSSDAVLRAQLVEFLDHKLVKQKRSAERTEYLIIPLKKEVLQQFLEGET